MYMTLREAATKYNLNQEETARFVSLLETEFLHLVFSNPDISVSAPLDAHLIRADAVACVAAMALAPSDVKTEDEIRSLREEAIQAIASWLSESNKSDHADFCADLRREPNPGTPPTRADFLTQKDVVSDIIGDLGPEVAAILPDLQQ